MITTHEVIWNGQPRDYLLCERHPIVPAPRLVVLGPGVVATVARRRPTTAVIAAQLTDDWQSTSRIAERAGRAFRVTSMALGRLVQRGLAERRPKPSEGGRPGFLYRRARA
jgi:hypothetical protein